MQNHDNQGRLSQGQSQKEMSSRARGTVGRWASPQLRKSLGEQPPGICSQAREGQEGNRGHSTKNFTGVSYLTNLTACLLQQDDWLHG